MAKEKKIRKITIKNAGLQTQADLGQGNEPRVYGELKLPGWDETRNTISNQYDISFVETNKNKLIIHVDEKVVVNGEEKEKKPYEPVLTLIVLERRS